MSNKNSITDTLISMGFQRNYIERAFKVYEKNYGRNYNIEVITEIIIRLQRKDAALKAKRHKNVTKSKPRCVCGIYLDKLKASSCYIGSNGVLCNECMSEISGDNFVYNCAGKKNRFHERGYDLCELCATKRSGFRHKHVNEWTCKELQAWIISLCIGNTSEKKIVTSIAEQEITGSDFNSMEEVSDVMDSFEITVSPAIKIFAALEQIRANKLDDNMEELEIPLNEEEIKQNTDNAKSTNNTDINAWDVNKLKEWIWSLHLNKANAKKVTDAIYEQDITGEDFNSMEEASEIMDSFEVKQNVANKIYNALEKLRGNVQEELQVGVSDEMMGNNDDDLIINDIVTKDANEHANVAENRNANVVNEISNQNDDNNVENADKLPKVKHKMKGKLAAKFGHLNIDPTKMKVGAAPPKRKKASNKQENEANQVIGQHSALNKPTIRKKGRKKRTKKKIIVDLDDVEPVRVENQNINQQVTTAPTVEKKNKKSVKSNKTYKNKNAKNWNNNDLLDWVKTIGLMTQWEEIMVGIIESKGCTGENWVGIKNFKELAKTFDIKQTMLANRVFREFKKAKKKIIEEDNNDNETNTIVTEEEVKQNVDKKPNLKKVKSPKAKSKAKPLKRIVYDWEKNDINKWTCNDLKQWMKSLDLNKNDKSKVVEAIGEQEVTGADFNSIEEIVDIMDALETNKNCATKIFSALQKVRNNT